MIAEAASILNLLLTKGVGAKTISEIVDYLAAHNLPREEIGLESLADALQWRAEFKNSAMAVQSQAAELAEELQRQNIQILVRGFGRYPQKLAQVLGRNAPPVLFAKGNLSILDGKAVGFCGSRHASDKGIRVAADSARLLGARGVNVVSGYAAGVDLVAHDAALEAGGVTAIVLAEGILHFRAKREIKGLLDDDNYVVASEYSPRLPWNARQAVQRNNTIIGLIDAIARHRVGCDGRHPHLWRGGDAAWPPAVRGRLCRARELGRGQQGFLGTGSRSRFFGDRQGRPNLGQCLRCSRHEWTGESVLATATAPQTVKPSSP